MCAISSLAVVAIAQDRYIPSDLQARGRADHGADEDGLLWNAAKQQPIEYVIRGMEPDPTKAALRATGVAKGLLTPVSSVTPSGTRTTVSAVSLPVVETLTSFSAHTNTLIHGSALTATSSPMWEPSPTLSKTLTVTLTSTTAPSSTATQAILRR